MNFTKDRNKKKLFLKKKINRYCNTQRALTVKAEPGDSSRKVVPNASHHVRRALQLGKTAINEH